MRFFSEQRAKKYGQKGSLLPLSNPIFPKVGKANSSSADNAAYRAALYGKGAAGLTRLWELTNTRYLLAPGGPWPERINQQLDPKQRRFRVAYPFSLERGSDSAALLTRRDPAGPFALLEFTGALPRASLFDRWQVLADGRAALEKLADPAFDPHQTVLLDQDPGIHPAAEPSATNAPAGEVSSPTAPNTSSWKPGPSVPPSSCSTTSSTPIGAPGSTASRPGS